MAVKPIPNGYHSVTPYLAVQGVEQLIDFLTKTFDARELLRLRRADGATAHAEYKIGDSIVMMGEPMETGKARPATLYVYVTDVDATYRRAVQAGGNSLSEPTDMFYGDRSATVTDPCGNDWWIATHKEDVSPDEMARRAQAQGE
jgi:PhnB protein